MMIPLWYAIVFPVTYLLFLIILRYCTTRLYPQFSIYRDTISEVQDTSTKSSRWINPTFFILGILLLPLPMFLYPTLPPSLQSYIGICIFYSNSIGLFIVAIWPDFTNNMHYVGAGVSLGGSLLSMIVLFAPIMGSTQLNKILLMIIIIALFICVLLVYSNVANGPRQILKYNPNFWEWMEFYTLQIWILAIFLNLLLI